MEEIIMKIPNRIEFTFIEYTPPGVVPKTIGKAIMYFADKNVEPLTYNSVSPHIGSDGVMQCHIGLEHAVRAYIMREAIRDEK